MGSSSSTTMHCINYLDHELETSRELERAKVSLKQLEVYRTAYEISRGWRKPNQFTYSHPNDEELGDVYWLVGELFPEFPYISLNYQKESSYLVRSNNQLVGCILVDVID